MTETPAKKAAAKAPATPNVTPETPNFTPDVEAAAERIKKTSERVLALSKENGPSSGWKRTRRCWTGCSSLRRTRPKVSVPTGSKNLCQRKQTLFVTRYGHTSVH